MVSTISLTRTSVRPSPSHLLSRPAWTCPPCPLRPFHSRQQGARVLTRRLSSQSTACLPLQRSSPFRTLDAQLALRPRLGRPGQVWRMSGLLPLSSIRGYARCDPRSPLVAFALARPACARGRPLCDITGSSLSCPQPQSRKPDARLQTDMPRPFVFSLSRVHLR